jgi:hypothetical protein
MKCDLCLYCSKQKSSEGKVEIECNKNGVFSISRDYTENFDCPLFTEHIEEKETSRKKVNALIIIKCGRDIPVHLSDAALKDIRSVLSNEEIMVLDEAVIRCSEVSAIQMLGD